MYSAYLQAVEKFEILGLLNIKTAQAIIKENIKDILKQDSDT